MKMPFGKFKGYDIDILPSKYLGWMAENIADEELCCEADKEYQLRTKLREHHNNDPRDTE